MFRRQGARLCIFVSVVPVTALGQSKQRTGAARLLAATGQTGRVDPPTLRVGALMVGDEANGSGSIRRRGCGRGIHERGRLRCLSELHRAHLGQYSGEEWGSWQCDGAQLRGPGRGRGRGLRAIRRGWLLGAVGIVAQQLREVGRCSGAWCAVRCRRKSLAPHDWSMAATAWSLTTREPQTQTTPASRVCSGRRTALPPIAKVHAAKPIVRPSGLVHVASPRPVHYHLPSQWNPSARPWPP